MSKRTEKHPRPPSEDASAGATLMPEQEVLMADLKRLEENFQRMADERESLHSQLLRTVADMQNYKKRVEQERQAIRTRATEDLLRDLLPVLDTFERTQAAARAGASVESMAEGVSSVDRLLRSILEARALKRIPSLGASFDPELHEALAVVPDSEEPAGTIVEELEAGYTLGGQVVRPARVKVAKGLP